MAPSTPSKSDKPVLSVWIEPEIRELEVRETANNPSVSSDGGVADCNHS